MGEQIYFACTVTYGGKWAPSMRWTDNRGVEIQAIDELPTTDRPTVGRRITFAAQAEMHNRTYTCHTSYTTLIPHPGPNEAENLPAYSHFFRSPKVNIHCKFEH